MEKYPTYKQSGIKWISEIPEHWVAQRFTHYFTFGKGLSITKADLKPNGISVISYGQIHSRLNNGIAILPEMIRYVDESYLQTDNNCLLNRNDFIFADTSEDILGSGNFAFNDLNTPIFAGYHTLIARPKGLECPKYIAFFMSSVNYRRQIQSLVNGVKVYSIGRNIIKKSTILLPPLPEQLSIVAFLEKATANIDAYIKQRQQEIIALNELKQAEIAEVVTKGINPNAPMKDSGISWIGKIPDHWQCNQLRKYLKLVSIKNKPNEQLLSVTREQGVIVRNVESKEENHNFIPEDLSGYKYVRKGQFAINKMKSWQGSYGVSNFDGIVSPAYFVCELNNINKEFFSWAIRSKAFIGFFTQMSKGIRVDQWDLSPIALKQIPFFEPPITEQQQIVDYIESKTSKIEEYIVALKSEIEQIQEYKQRLISDVVTGKVDVRNVAVEKMEDIPEEEIEETEELENSEE